MTLLDANGHEVTDRWCIYCGQAFYARPSGWRDYCDRQECQRTSEKLERERTMTPAELRRYREAAEAYNDKQETIPAPKKGELGRFRF